MLSERLRTEPLFGLPFTSAPLHDVRDHLLEALARGRQQVVITANTDHVVRLRRHPDLIGPYLAADLVLPDGMPVVWGSRLVGADLPGRVTGVDLMEALCEALARHARGVYLLGSTEDVLAQAAQTLEQGFPGLVIAGTHHGFFHEGSDPAVVDAINASGADALFVGMGSPRQERWAAANADAIAPRLVLCVGGSLEVLAGVRRRAPGWMQPSGLEWAYRLVQEPGRLWKRYLIQDAAFLFILAGEWRSRRLGRRALGVRHS
jgi:N-acetylglucosaminyldiphosphoundecaprenol N-acetyl-beta-D-mannosaminyltransferase